MADFVDLTGERFFRWEVLERAENRDGKVYWWCKCDCGTVKEVAGKSLKNGQSKSCGCLRKENRGRPGKRKPSTSNYQKRKMICERCGGEIWTSATVRLPRYCQACLPIVGTEPPSPHEMLNNPDTKLCRTCRFREYVNLSSDGKRYYGCQYLNITGEKRPCKPGKDCMAYEKRKGGGG